MKNIKFLMLIISVLIAGKAVAQETAEPYYEPELLMVSQPKMELYSSNDNDYVQFYYDVENIGSETYKGDFMILMEPDVDHFYVKKNIKVKAGEIKRIKMEMDLGLLYYDSVYTVLPVYEFENQWYPLTAYEKFKSIMLCLNAPLDDDYVVTSAPAPVTNYHFDVRLQRPPVYGYYYVTPPSGWAYAYGYSPCCVCNNYIIVENNGTYSTSGGSYIGSTSSQTVVVPNVNVKTSAPRVSNNYHSNSAASSARSQSSGRNNATASSGTTTSTRNRSTSSSSSSGITTSGSRGSSSSSSSVTNSSSSRPGSSSTARSSSSSRPTNNSSSTISNSSSSRSSSSRSSSSSGSSSRSSSSSSSSSSSRSSSSSSSSSSGGGRR